MTIDEVLRLGDASKYLLESAEFKNVIAAMRKDINDAWLSSQAGETTAREQLYYAIKAVDGLENRLKANIDNADVERRRAEQVTTDLR